jgi:hypothetical protein
LISAGNAASSRMTNDDRNRRPSPRNSVRAYRERVLGQSAKHRDQAAQSLKLSAAMVAKARELVAQTRKRLRQTEPPADKEHSAQTVAGKVKSGSIPYSVATHTGDNLALNRQLQAEQHALLEKNRELRQAIEKKLQRHRDALRGEDIRKR